MHSIYNHFSFREGVGLFDGNIIEVNRRSDAFLQDSLSFTFKNILFNAANEADI